MSIIKNVKALFESTNDALNIQPILDQIENVVMPALYSILGTVGVAFLVLVIVYAVRVGASSNAETKRKYIHAIAWVGGVIVFIAVILIVVGPFREWWANIIAG